MLAGPHEDLVYFSVPSIVSVEEDPIHLCLYGGHRPNLGAGGMGGKPTRVTFQGRKNELVYSPSLRPSGLMLLNLVTQAFLSPAAWPLVSRKPLGASDSPYGPLCLGPIGAFFSDICFS